MPKPRSRATSSSTTLPDAPFGMLIIPSADASPLPLEKTTIAGQVSGPLATITVIQHFTNPSLTPVELEYLFPLPHKAAIIDFAFRIDQRIIKADLRETEKARQDFEEALSHGQQAALLEARRPNLFAIRLANVKPGELIQTEIHYQETIAYRDGEYELVIPMGLTPKYTSPAHPEEGKGVDAPIASAGDKIGPVEIALMVDAGTALGDPTSPSHTLQVVRLDERRINLWLANPAIPDHDFVLRLPVAREALKLTAFYSTQESDGYFFASLLPPVEAENQSVPAPREFIFVLDRSGSMSGQPITQARNALRACLRILNPGDTFAILLFDDRLDWYHKRSDTVTQKAIDEADAFLSGVEGRGGTEIIPAIEAALDHHKDPERLRYVVFLTDGAVSADERAISEVRSKLGAARFFTFGIGPSVNRALLQKLAAVGRGTSEFLQLDEDIEGAIMRFQDRVSFPVITDLKLECRNGQVWDTYPTILPDVYSGSPLEIVGRVKAQKHTAPRLVVSGLRQGKPVEMSVELAPLPAPEPAVLRAWARARVDDLEQQAESAVKPAHKARDEIINLAIEHRLVTRFTSFVAIETSVVNPDGKPRLIQISQPLPEGLDIRGFIPSAPAYFMAPPPAAQATGVVRHAKMMKMNMEDRMQPFEDLNLPAFLRSPNQVHEAGTPSSAQPQDAETLLRWLARTQNLDGSWQAGAEFTALALYFFIKNGQTTRSGHYRIQVKRAAGWLIKSMVSGLPQFLTALAIQSLADATGFAEDAKKAAGVVSLLPIPGNDMESIAASRLNKTSFSIPTISVITELDDLRLARLAGLPLPAPDFLLQGSDADLGRLWSVVDFS